MTIRSSKSMLLPTSELTLDTAAVKMRGATGTNVSLAGANIRQLRPAKLILVRQKIQLNPVTAELHTENGRKIGYLRLAQFSAKAAQELADNITKFQATRRYRLYSGSYGIILVD